MAKAYIMSINNYNDPIYHKAFTSAEKAVDYMLKKYQKLEDMSVYVDHRPNNRSKVDTEELGYLRKICHRLKGGWGMWVMADGMGISIEAVIMNPVADPNYSDIL